MVVVVVHVEIQTPMSYLLCINITLIKQGELFQMEKGIRYIREYAQIQSLVLR